MSDRRTPKLDISLTFPCYNEQANVAKMIDSSLAVLGRLGHRYEVIVSNDGSRDRTQEIAEAHVAKQPDVVRVLNQYPNRGYGHALRMGLEAARYEWGLLHRWRLPVRPRGDGERHGRPSAERSAA